MALTKLKSPSDLSQWLDESAAKAKVKKRADSDASAKRQGKALGAALARLVAKHDPKASEAWKHLSQHPEWTEHKLFWDALAGEFFKGLGEKHKFDTKAPAAAIKHSVQRRVERASTKAKEKPDDKPAAAKAPDSPKALEARPTHEIVKQAEKPHAEDEPHPDRKPTEEKPAKADGDDSEEKPKETLTQRRVHADLAAMARSQKAAEDAASDSSPPVARRLLNDAMRADATHEDTARAGVAAVHGLSAGLDPMEKDHATISKALIKNAYGPDGVREAVESGMLERAVQPVVVHDDNAKGDVEVTHISGSGKRPVVKVSGRALDAAKDAHSGETSLRTSAAISGQITGMLVATLHVLGKKAKDSTVGFLCEVPLVAAGINVVNGVRSLIDDIKYKMENPDGDDDEDEDNEEEEERRQAKADKETRRMSQHYAGLLAERARDAVDDPSAAAQFKEAMEKALKSPAFDDNMHFWNALARKTMEKLGKEDAPPRFDKPKEAYRYIVQRVLTHHGQ